MSLVLPYQQHQPYLQQQMVSDEDDLSMLLGSDAFSLESSRDRDLLLLSSLLQTSLPPGSSPPHAHAFTVTSPTQGAHPSMAGGSWSQANGGSGWGSMGGRGDDNAYASTSSKPFDPSQGNNGATQHTATPHGTPLLHTLALPPASSPLEDFTARDGSVDWSRRGGRVGADGQSNYGAGTWGTTPGVSPQFAGVGGGGAGVRAPAVSRERGVEGRKRIPSVEEGLPTYQQSFASGFGWAQREEDDDMMVEEDEGVMDAYPSEANVVQRPWSYQL